MYSPQAWARRSSRIRKSTRYTGAPAQGRSNFITGSLIRPDLVLVKFVEFVANKKRHEFHELTRVASQLLRDYMATQINVEELCINTIRTLAMDAVQKAKSGHPGMPMGMASVAYVLWTRFMRHIPRNPHWEDRDRVALSAGDGAQVV